MVLDKLCDNVESELSAIVDRGLNANNIDSAYKLVDIYKNIKKIDEIGGYSGAYRKRDSMGRYTRDDGHSYGHDGNYSRYMDSKREYRENGSSYAKEHVMKTLSDYMDGFTHEIEELIRDADSPEERQAIQRYLNKVKTF